MLIHVENKSNLFKNSIILRNLFTTGNMNHAIYDLIRSPCKKMHDDIELKVREIDQHRGYKDGMYAL